MKITKVLWILIAIVGIGWIYYLFISPMIFKPTIVEVPNIVGFSEKDAKRVLEEKKIKYNILYIDGINPSVDATIPKAGNKVYNTYTIEVYVKKPLPSYYNSYVGLIFEENQELIEEYCSKHQISYRVEYEINNEYPSGQIFYQSKNQNDIVQISDEIVFKVAVSNEYFSMPNFIGENIYNVIQVLDEYKLNYNIIYYNAPIDADIVLSQSILEGTIIKKGNDYAFDIYVSKGMPNEVSSILLDDFIFVLNEIGYFYDIIYVDSTVNSNNLLKIEFLDKWLIYISK